MPITDTAATPSAVNDKPPTIVFRAVFCHAKVRQIVKAPTGVLCQILVDQALTDHWKLTPTEQGLIAAEIDRRRDVHSRRLDLLEQIHTPRARLAEALERAAACRLSAALGYAAEAKAAARSALEVAHSLRTATTAISTARRPAIGAAEITTKATVNPITAGLLARWQRARRALPIMVAALY